MDVVGFDFGSSDIHNTFIPASPKGIYELDTSEWACKCTGDEENPQDHDFIQEGENL